MGGESRVESGRKCRVLMGRKERGGHFREQLRDEKWLLSVSQKQPGSSDSKKCDDEKRGAKWAAAGRQARPEHVQGCLV